MPNKSPAPQRPAPAQTGGTYLYLRASQLQTHPTNMRRVYPIGDVRQMAESIRGMGGVIHALIVVPDGQPDSYYVVDGNMRLAGARLLGTECPPLKCEVVAQDQAEQHLTMAGANTVRFDVDPISEALHFRRLEADGLTHLEIAERSGVKFHRVGNRLKLLQLDGAIQRLIAAGQLPTDVRVADALLSIPNATARVRLAERLAEQGATIKAVINTCDRLAEALAARKEKPAPELPRLADDDLDESPPAPIKSIEPTPMLQLGMERAGYGLPNGDRAGWGDVRAAALKMCAGCDIKTETLRNQVPEPAWTLLAHVATETCNGCNVRDVESTCKSCPGVELLSRLIRGAQAQGSSILETAPERRFG